MDVIAQSNSVLDMSRSVENEFICAQIAKELGFRVPDMDIITVESGAKALAVKRFDRCFGDGVVTRRHQEDFCQIFGVPEHQKYQSENNLSVSKIVDVLSLSAQSKANNHDFLNS